MFTSAQAVDAGLTRAQVDHALGRGRWRRVAGRGLVAADQAIGPWQRAWAAQLTWPDAVVTGPHAAALHGWPVATSLPVDVLTERRRRPVRGIRPLRWAADVVVLPIGGVDVSDPVTTAAICLARMPWGEALDLFAWTASRQVFDRSDLAATLRAWTGRPGAGQLLRLLRTTRHGALSAAEHRLHEVLRRGGLTGWVANAPAVDAAGRTLAVADVLFRAARLIVEVDGYGAHSGRQAFVRDRRRQNALINAGYRVLRFTWDDLVDRPDRVIAEIRTALGVG